MDAEGHGEVELINVAPANPFVNGGDALSVLIFSDGQSAVDGLIVKRVRIGHRSTELNQRRWVALTKSAGLMVEEVRLLVDAEPG